MTRVVAIGLWRGEGDFGNALELATRWPEVFSATIGVHPHECARVGEADWARSAELAGDPRVVGVGETGLDFHYDLSPRDVQEALLPPLHPAGPPGGEAAGHPRARGGGGLPRGCCARRGSRRPAG